MGSGEWITKWGVNEIIAKRIIPGNLGRSVYQRIF
jgi:hypothetical protein